MFSVIINLTKRLLLPHGDKVHAVYDEESVLVNVNAIQNSSLAGGSIDKRLRTE